MSRKSKLDVNRVTTDELVEVAGLRPAVAAALIRHRDEAGAIADLEGLIAVSGIGAGTLERIKATMRVAAEPAASPAASDEAGAVSETEPAAPAAGGIGVTTIRAVADIAEKVSDARLAVAEKAVHGGERLTAAARANGVWARAPSRAAPVGDEIGALWLAAFNAQVEDGMVALKGMVGARNVNDLVELQTRFLSQSLGRLADLQSRSIAAMGKLAQGSGAGDR